ncbi:MAG: hypothetical protein ACI959_000033 [Limisphaerales bacterium]|jgi:hypothetical protein
MQIQMNKSIYRGLSSIMMLLVVLTFASCEIDPVLDPNNPSVAGVSENATRSEIQNLIDGIQSGMRNSLNQYYDAVGVVGREYYRFSDSDPRLTSDLLGGGEAVLDNNTFYTTGPYAARYRVVNNCNILINAAENTSNLTSDEVEVTVGFAKTIMAHELLMVLNQQYGNGIRTDVADFNNLGAFRSLTESLSDLSTILDDAATSLAGGAEFPFGLTSGFATTSSPGTFVLFNRALAARVHLYRGNYDDALTALDNSFYDMMGDFNTGVFLPYSFDGGDLTNPMWFPANQAGETRVAQIDFVPDADPQDARLYKATLRDAAAFSDELTSDYDVSVYASNIDPISLIRNEELILIFAEAHANNANSGDAITAIDMIRTTHGLIGYTGGPSPDELIDEILVQRRYSLYGEGHRWVDMRRNGKLGELPIDRVGDDVWEQFPVPATEG